jgi:lipoate-protein ligase B
VTQPLASPVFDANPLTAPEGFRVWRPGLMAYRDAATHQEKLISQRHHWSSDLLILLEHPPVITLGRNSNEENLLWSREVLRSKGIDCVTSRRGGDITLHSPGQLVGYPIVDLNHYQRDLHRFLRLLEKTLIKTLSDFGLAGESLPGKTGVWIAGRKIASIGVAVRRWISYHGFALNIDNDLAAFEAIVPCGLANVTMTSMSRELERPINRNAVSEALIGHFSVIMQRPFLGNFNDCTTSSQT